MGKLDDFECTLRINRGITIYISRLSRYAERDKRIFTGGIVTKNRLPHVLCSSRSVFYLEVILPKWPFSSSSFLESGFSAGVRRTSVTRRLAVRVTTPS